MSRNNNQQHTEERIAVENIANQQQVDTSKQNETIQVDNVYTITQDVAKNVLHIRKNDKNSTQKILVIGHAMIAQKEVLADILRMHECQTTTYQVNFGNMMGIHENISTKLDNVCASLEPLQDTHEVQNEIIQSLQVLKKQHLQFINDCQKSKKQQISYMSELQKQLCALRQVLDDTAIAEGFVHLEVMLKAVITTFNDYQDTRKQQHAMISQYMSATKNSLAHLQKDIVVQKEAVNRIEKQAIANHDIVVNISDKLDGILAQCESNIDSKLPTLEEAFAHKEPQNTVQDTKPETREERLVKKSMMNRLFGGK